MFYQIMNFGNHFFMLEDSTVSFQFEDLALEGEEKGTVK